MASYYVNDNAQADSGDHEVHVRTCPYFHLISSKTCLGEYYSCAPAVAKAKTIYRNSDGCAYCCPACHTG